MTTITNRHVTWNAMGDGIATCRDPILGGIIDREIVSGLWFIIFNDDTAAMDGFATRADAMEAHNAAMEAKYILA